MSLEREAAVFTRYLTGMPADAYIVRRYAHAHSAIEALSPRTAVDRLLVGWARRGRIAARMADAYARFFAPAGALRQKMVLLFALLESRAPHHRVFEVQRPRHPAVTVAGLFLAGVGGALALVAGVVVLGPPHLVLKFVASPAGVAAERREAV